MSSTCLLRSFGTGYPYSVRSKSKDQRLMNEICVPVIIGAHGASAGSGQVAYIFIGELDNTRAYSSEYQIFSQVGDEKTLPEANILSTRDQIDSIRKIMGLNISDVAAVLQVSRPTVYQWLNSEISVRNSHQERLNDIYDICLFWGRKRVGCLSAYLYKKTNNLSKSLIETLAEDQLDKNKIHYFLNQIEQLVSQRRSNKDKNDSLLKQHGFEEISEEELEKNFNANIQSIG